MFNFLSMLDNYDDRKVARFEQDDLIIDTCSVNDGKQLYETAIQHPKYNDGLWVIVQAYDTKEQAQNGHDYWVTIMLENPPEYLRDCCNSYIAQLCDMFGDEQDNCFYRDN